MKKITLILVSTWISAAVSVAAPGPAVHPGDTIVIGNRLIRETLVWDGAFIWELRLTDLVGGKSYELDNRYPAVDVEFFEVAVPADTIHFAHRLQILNYRNDSLRVSREYRIHEGVAAIACDNWFKGRCDRFNPSWVLASVTLPSPNWKLTAVEFFDATDNHDTLVRETYGYPFRKNAFRGNLLLCADPAGNSGIWMLKEAPSSRSQLAYGGKDFTTEANTIRMTGVGIDALDTPTDAVKGYSSVIGFYDGSPIGASRSLRAYQKVLRRHIPARDEMVMMNTWGDRSQDTRVGESFCIEELRLAARLGISHFQIDDGWQCGKSPNSATAGGSFDQIWDAPDYWTPDPAKYPSGLTPVVEAAEKEGITLGLWYNPSTKNDFGNWQDDAGAILGLWRKYGIKVYKIDGVELPNKTAEANFRKLLDRVREESGNEVVFNLDVTAGRRGGYFMFNDYGNLFLENRYTDWGNYYPYRTLRNLWMLSRYVPPENLQVEFLNNWRNAEKYDAADRLAPAGYSFEYLFAITMAGQPLAWMEASNLPEEAFAVGDVIRRYHEVAADFHHGDILPIGHEPSGYSWTGFQSILDDHNGYLLIYREFAAPAIELQTCLPSGSKVKLTPILGSGKQKSLRVGADGHARFTLPAPNSYALYKYTL